MIMMMMMMTIDMHNVQGVV